MATKKEAENHEVKAFLATDAGAGGVTFGPLTKSAAEDLAKEICSDGCEKDGTYYPAHQVTKVKVYQIDVQ